MSAVLEAPGQPRITLDYPQRPDGTYGPNGPQRDAHLVDADEVLYGGAAGGGKTAWLVAEALLTAFEFPGCQIALFRRTYDQLIELGGIAWILKDRIPLSIGRYNESTRIWKFKNGSRIRLNYLARDADVTKLQGAEYALVGFDQVEQFTEFQYTYVLHRLRVSGPLKSRMERAGFNPRAIATANPGGVGHGWVKRRWIDRWPLGHKVWTPEPTEFEPNPLNRCYIPARVYDNLSNLHPSYLRRLQALPEDLRRAMLDGDWNVYAGQKFKGFKHAVHVIPAGSIPMNVLLPQRRALGVDYGMDAPFCALWGAKMPDSVTVIYRELYQAELTPEQQAKLILASEMPGERTSNRPIPVALDPSTWIRNPHDLTEGDPKTGAPPPSSIAGIYWRNGVPVRKAINNRLAGVARVHEKLQLRPDKTPRLLIMDNCRNLIRTLPELVTDNTNPEDVDTDGEDHAFDAMKYLLFQLEPISHVQREITSKPSGHTQPARSNDNAPRPRTDGLVGIGAAGIKTKRF